MQHRLQLGCRCSTDCNWAATTPNQSTNPSHALVICRAPQLRNPHSSQARSSSWRRLWLLLFRRPSPFSSPSIGGRLLPPLPSLHRAAAATMKGPGLFSDIGKKAKGTSWSPRYRRHLSLTSSDFPVCGLWSADLLSKDYTYDQKLTISTASASGLVRSDRARVIPFPCCLVPVRLSVLVTPDLVVVAVFSVGMSPCGTQAGR
jgi:hypothetical protein